MVRHHKYVRPDFRRRPRRNSDARSRRRLSHFPPLATRSLLPSQKPHSHHASSLALLKALQNADYVPITRGTAPPSTGATAGTPSKRDGTQIEGQVEQQQQQHQRHQAAAYPLLTDVDSENVQAAIQRLFDASIMLEDSAFRDFVGPL